MMLRKVLFSILILIIVSCSKENDVILNSSRLNTYDEFLTVSKVLIPQEIKVNTETKIKVYYTIPTTCHQFKDIFQDKKDTTRTYAVVSEVLKRNDCIDSLKQERIDLNFKTDKLGNHYLRFWTGKDKEDKAKYLIYSVQVKK